MIAGEEDGDEVSVNLGKPPAPLNWANENAALLLLLLDTAILVLPIARLIAAFPPVG
jgi:hypothetical protein